MKENREGVGIIIPAYNEEDRIAAAVESIIRLPWIEHILVVDDGSTDDTAKTARKAGAEVLILPKNMGKAHAMKTGYLYLSDPILVFLDGDITEGAEQVSRLVKPIWDRKAEAVVARFPTLPHAKDGGFGLVKGLASKGLEGLTGKSFPSVLSGQRAILRKVLMPKWFDYRGYGIEFGMTVDMLLVNVNLIEVDVTMEHRRTGRDFRGFYHRYRQFKDILVVLLRKLWEKHFNKGQGIPLKESDDS